MKEKKDEIIRLSFMDVVRIYETSPEKDKYSDFNDWASVHIRRKEDVIKEFGIEYVTPNRRSSSRK